MSSPLLVSSASAPSLSPSRSPLLSPTSSPQNRRLSTRRGSVTAADPWGTHTGINNHPDRTTSSRLTILRVQEPPFNLQDPPQSGPGSTHHRRHQSLNHRRNPPGGSTGNGKPDGGRVSFASSSFGSGHNGRPGSPTSPRPGSPVRNRPPSSSFSQKRLSPDELFELARKSSNPQYSPSPRPSPRSPHSGVDQEPQMAPAQFTPLPDDIWLPFIDRPAEVSALLSTPPTSRLFALLAQIFPSGKIEHISSPSSTELPLPQSPSPNEYISTAGDPATWSLAQLSHWLKRVDRDVAPDDVWVRKARTCILAHSELVWVRMKSALGVPPELDMDEDELEDDAQGAFAEFDRDVGTSGAISPMPDLPPSFVHRPEHEQAIEASKQAGSDASSLEEADFMDPETSPEFGPEIRIEPVVSPSTPPPSSDPMMGGLQDITEEESENASDLLEAGKPKDAAVHGIRISTSPASPNALGPVEHSPFSFSFSSPSPGAYHETDNGGHGFSYSPVLNRRSSVGSHYSVGSDMPYDALRERGPGNPLFPSNFANLAMGPTLSANNPSLRRLSHPPPPAYANPHSIRDAVKGRRRVPSWAEGWDPSKNEYAVTVGSGSSVVE